MESVRRTQRGHVMGVEPAILSAVFLLRGAPVPLQLRRAAARGCRRAERGWGARSPVCRSMFSPRGRDARPIDREMYVTL